MIPQPPNPFGADRRSSARMTDRQMIDRQRAWLDEWRRAAEVDRETIIELQARIEKLEAVTPTPLVDAEAEGWMP